ncbi:protein-(glutamine-N5) methyltransferase, release factor-specific [Sphaerochaeta pleomorpha str. Grapes]|uniref:Release factor glutamine methyltransferase n=1 Tax=Sphaerochaeta pleomorpha (strain ATCC BAA-1885 / DSM 22778 / Grapes) TaxID=158190 RepID=G8QVX4_SPHPG|nr:peptide chain release factor N(5)-glutamine methyltransferase [Sphaerochaeta pleomorpha]AEV30498.1 protein-(glutamine-N5) methyltransferase, release factor-specific [Sphaerochaeta pleomorpha str. Grapes]
MEGLSLAQAKEMCRKALLEAGITDTADLDARLLLEKATSLSQIDLILHYDSPLGKEQATLLEGYLKARLDNEPIAYILQEKEFYGRTFKVDKRVLIPRPDTETLVDTAIVFAKTLKKNPKIIDVCTGSGCVGITLAAELAASVTLSDISEDALSVANENACSLLGHPLPLLKGNLLCPSDEKYDIIVSNPPYLTAIWCEEVAADVKKEPRLALEGFGNDGLDCIRTLIKQSTTHLEKGGSLMLECDYRQTAKVAELFRESGFTEIRSEKDLSLRERVIWGIL